MLACSAMVACTNDDVLENIDSPVVKGDKAYVVVNIKSANGVSSRGTEGNPEFEDGIDAENEVTSATFFFYDANGKYVTKSAPGTTFSAKDPANDNVEEISNSVVVLQGLNGKNYPNYVVAVLNCPTEIVNRLHNGQFPLSQVKTELVNTATANPYLNASGKFIMSNSTYNNGNAVSQYFATPLAEANFLQEQPNEEQMSSTNVVNIYVERLAAKANLTLADKAKGKIALTKYDVDGQDATLYVEVLNWKLNGTNKNTYLMKNVDETFTAYQAGAENSGIYAFDWAGTEAKGYFRTYWGKSYNWGKGTYPAGFSADLTTDALTLNYYSWNAMTPEEGTTIETAQYCAENTNSETFLNAGNFHSTVTEALLQAKVYTQIGDGEEVATDLIRYNNTLFTKEGFIARVVKNAGLEGKLYKYSEYADEQGALSWKVKQIEAKDFKYVNLGNGIVTVQFKDVERGEDGKITGVTATTGERDNVEYKWYASPEIPKDENNQILEATVTIDMLNAYEDQINALAIQAECYKDGMMYYNIPIEHLRGGKFEYVSTTDKPVTGDGSADTEPEDIRVNEADYGVVRNHYYNITVNKIENLGNAVLDPDEIIIPIDKNNTTYYVGATINILSWKVVNQSVDL